VQDSSSVEVFGLETIGQFEKKGRERDDGEKAYVMSSGGHRTTAGKDSAYHKDLSLTPVCFILQPKNPGSLKGWAVFEWQHAVSGT